MLDLKEMLGLKAFLGTKKFQAPKKFQVQKHFWSEKIFMGGFYFICSDLRAVRGLGAKILLEENTEMKMINEQSGNKIEQD